MEDVVKRYKIPAFGNWEYCNELPISEYFESAAQTKLVMNHYYFEEANDNFNLAAHPVKPAYVQHHRKVKKVASSGDQKNYSYSSEQIRRQDYNCSKEQQRKQGRVCDVASQTSVPRRTRAPKAVDEDLYKIPPEFFYQKPKKKKLLTSLWNGCLGVSCIA